MQADGIVIDFNPTRRDGTGTVTVKLGDKVLAVDTLNITKASARTKFAREVAAERTGIKVADLERELLRLAGDVATAKPEVDAAPDRPELDVSSIVRPELFHTVDVSGVTVPTRILVGAEPKGNWRLYLRWHENGAREERELDRTIELPSEGRLWFHTLPAEPTPTMQAGWSVHARRAWLNDSDVPDPASVFKRTCKQLAWYLDFPLDTAAGSTATLAVWVLLTYCYPAWRVIPYLSIGGPLGSGKSHVLDLLDRLVFRPVRSSNMTAPCLFRTLHEQGGTLLLDEAEQLRDRASEVGELRSILLSGYKVGSPAWRLEKVGDGYQHVAFDVFGPKAIAGIARLPEALASRCIRLTMFRAGQDSPKPRRRIDENRAVWAELRDDLYALALEHGRTWLDLQDRTDVCPVMSGRDYELWQALLALAAWLEEAGASGLLDLMREYAQRTIELGQDDATPDTDEMLLRLLAETVVAGTNHQTQPKDLLDRARQEDPQTFSRWTPRGVAVALKRYRLETRKVNGRRIYRDVTLADLRGVEQVYALDLGLPTESAPTDPTDPENGQQGAETGALGALGTVSRG